MENEKSSKDYKAFLSGIKDRIRTAQYEALRTVNKELINLYWDIGKAIVEKQEKLGWGKSVVEQLSKDLRKDFNRAHGFSVSNLWRMRTLYLIYHKQPKLAPLVRETYLFIKLRIRLLRNISRVKQILIRLSPRHLNPKQTLLSKIIIHSISWSLGINILNVN